jgi:hypothetical protein
MQAGGSTFRRTYHHSQVRKVCQERNQEKQEIEPIYAGCLHGVFLTWPIGGNICFRNVGRSPNYTPTQTLTSYSTSENHTWGKVIP